MPSPAASAARAPVTSPTSSRSPLAPLHGCDCEGYFRWERCKHYALCVEAAGWLPDVELLAAGDELDDHDLWEAAVATSPAAPPPIPLMSRTDPRAVGGGGSGRAGVRR